MKKSLLLPLLVYVSILSCQKSVNNRILDDIESYIQTKPDSALTALSRIDTSSLRAPKMRAQYALLLAMALDKNYIDTTDLSVIRPAVEYYQGHGTPRQKMLAYYYEGRILYNGKRDAEATISQMHALQNAQQVDAGRYLGMIYTAMADLSSRSYCWKEATTFLEQAEIAFRQSKDTLSTYLVQERSAINYSNQGYYVVALSLLDSLLKSDQMPAILRSEFTMNKACMMVDTTSLDYSMALNCFLEAFKLGAQGSATQLARYAYALAKCGYQKESTTIFLSLSKSDNPDYAAADTWRQELLANEGEYEVAYKLLRSRLDNQEERINQILSQSLFRSQRDYFQTRDRELLLKNRNQRLLIILLALAFFIIVVCLGKTVAHFRKKAMLKEMEMERFSESMANMLNDRDQSFSVLQAQFCHIHKEQFKLLEKYYKDFEMARRSGAGEKELYNRLLAIVKDIEGDTDGQRYLDALIDEQYDGVMKKLSSECPNLSKQDYLLFSYTAAGFDSSTIGMLFGNLSADALHTRRSRLRKALKSINPMSLQDFLGLLDRR